MVMFKEGQRWISDAEPDLGLGTVLQVAPERVNVMFPATGELRQYARDNAPLRRVRFRKGDRIESHEGRELTVRAVREEAGLITYLGEGEELPETQLNDRISVHGPEERLLAGRVDEPGDFDLRCRAWNHLYNARKSPVRGFVGGRIDLIPHQLYIAHEVSSRHAPRVLLSDEVGLGKTIEAGLILHRLLLSGRASRLLILVPESLVHQWFVEMLRRFNIWMNIFDEERCEAIQSGQPEANPFLDDQWVLCSLDFLSASPTRARQAVEAGWDLLVVDEAHHLEWSPAGASAEYGLVEALSLKAEGLLLLTATPEQVGPESHFARLRLLDPDRYGEFETFRKEGETYRAVAGIAEKLPGTKALTRNERTELGSFFDRQDPASRDLLASMEKGDAAARVELLNRLLDLHGPGRVMFRNTRNVIQGFPGRHVRLAPLRADKDHDEWVDRVSTEFAVDAGDEALTLKLELEGDPRVLWLAGLLRELGKDKVLLICRSSEKALALDLALRREINMGTGIFHEGLTLVQRDRNAAWFAEEHGCRLLICSEIGSEGRNFQFAHHLVLFDLPLNPELLEQRIGRLDRIGQTRVIRIHVPYLEGSPQEVLATWYHEGLDAFESSLEGGNALLRQFGRQVHDLALEFPAGGDAVGELARLLKTTAAERKALRQRLEEGRDRLLELNSFRPESARALVEAIGEEDRNTSLEEFMLDVFEHFGVHAEDLAPRTFGLNPQGVTTEAFPSIPAEGMMATFDRKRALGRDDVGLLTLDHPMVTGAIDLILSAETGNSSFALWPVESGPGLLLETLFILEPIADAKWHVDRFLPSTPFRVVVDHHGKDVTGKHSSETFREVLRKGRPHELLEQEGVTRELVPRMLEAAREVASARGRKRVGECLKAVEQGLGNELERLRALSKVNDHVRPREVELAEEQRGALTRAIGEARLRLDGLRLICRQVWEGGGEVGYGRVGE